MYLYNSSLFDVIVIGGGHSGIEASYVSSKMKRRTLLITYNKNNIGEISCNPSIGGIGKSNLVKEVDAMGGVIGKITDYSAIQYKTLNSSKGEAVRATRAQIDRNIYKKNAFNELKKLKYLTIYQGEVVKLIVKNKCVKGVKTSKKEKIYSHTVIICTGTFLNSKIFIGLKSIKGGRISDHSSEHLANYLSKYNFNLKYFKTGTPPRIKKKTINFKVIKKILNDKNINYFSYFNNIRKKRKKLKEINCYLTYTNIKTHNIIKKNLNKNALHKGIIVGKGPRYCPSIEDKIINFSNKKRHRIFLEPENIDEKIIYPNGISMSLPFKIQKKIIQTIKGMENAKILVPGYAVEYLFLNPKDLKKTLESKIIRNLYFAGQINGTTGYEEASAQGLIAGINASLNIVNKKFILDRSISYIGVLIDDLCNKGVNEPYRIFTSRSEHRLFLREDNADYRLTPLGYKLGLISKKKWFYFKKKMNYIKNNYNFLKEKKISVNDLPNKIKSKLKKKIKKIYLNNLIIKDYIKHKEFINIFKKYNKKINFKYIKETKIILKYQGYIKKQKIELHKFNKYKDIYLFKFNKWKKIPGLSNEVIEKLNKYKPKYLNQAYEIPGITPASIINIIIYLKKKKKI